MPPLTGFNNKGFNTQTTDLRQTMSNQMTQQTSKKPWWTALISELGGAGGAATGAATGATIGSVIPGIGTAIGGLVGGAAGAFLGGTGGRLAENKIRDNRFNVGSALGEGTTDAVFSGASGLNDIRKGAKAAKALSSVARVADAPDTIISKAAKGIPVKYVPNLANGTATTQISRNTLTNPNIEELGNAIGTLKKNGFIVQHELGSTPGSILSPKSSSVALTGRRTAIPLSTVDAGNPETLLAKPQAVTTTIIPGASGDLSSVIRPPERVGLLQGIGKSLRVGASGYGIGAGSAANQLDANASDAIGNTLKTLRIPATAPETQARMLGGHIDNLENVLSAQYTKANVPVTQREINHLGANIIGQVTNTGGLSKGAENFALEQAQKLSKAKDVNEVWQFTKDLARNATNFGANPDSKLVDKEAAARIILDQTRGFLNGKVPGVAATNDLYHQAKTAEKFILDAAKDKGGGLIQRGMSLASVKAAEAKTGALLEGVGKFTAGTGAPITQLTHQGVVQAPGNLLHSFTDAQQPAQAPQSGPQALLGSGQSQDTTASLLGQANGGGDATSALLGQSQQSTSQSGPSLQSLQQAIQQDISSTGGKNIDHLMQLGQLYGIVDSSGNPTGTNGGKTLSAAATKDVANATGGLESLQQLATTIQQSGVPKATIIPGRTLLGGLGASKLGTGAYDTAARNVQDVITRLRSGAAITDQEAAFYSSQLPQAFDSADTIQRKLQSFQDLFTRIATQGGGQGSQQVDLLSQMNGAQ